MGSPTPTTGSGASRGTDDTAGTTCTRRGYTLDADSNRTAFTTQTGAAGASCGTGTVTTTSAAYDAADRVTTDTYDPLGRTTGTTTPGTVSTGGGATTVGYYDDDLVRSTTNVVGSTGVTRTYALDPAIRVAQVTSSGLTGNNPGQRNGTSTYHFTGGDDGADWVTEPAAGTVTRNIMGLDGNLALVQTTTGNSGSWTTNSAEVQINDLHGSTDGTQDYLVGDGATPGSTALTGYSERDENGVARTTQRTNAGRYDWLGGKTRSSEASFGLVLMGVRLFSTTTGRFLSTDPVPGGSANDYDYCSADPVNCYDLDGRWGIPKWAKKAARFVGSAAKGGLQS